ncbi:unnamed protein product [Enterobius vermicularis]|uniref:Exocyst complex component Sec8 n=1 Tax=Enterobius vermicularis TaxID=51028 RepID=A0A0N4UXM5_ENTVE|nr:unnamed protein product [Enterobius vermicularis]
MSVQDEKPRAAPRRLLQDQSQTTQENTSALFLNMIRALITSTSEDQRELDRRHLEQGFADSSKAIDALVREHEYDVKVCLESFRTVSSKITACRERMHSLKSGLLSCRSLLQCRRDDLKRLWMENAQQKHVSRILDQIDKVKRLEGEVEEAISHAEYLTAANSLKEADLLLNGPFSNIDGLNNLRIDIHEASKKLVEHIVDDIVSYLIVRPFEFRLVEVIKSFPESKVAESKECMDLLERNSGVNLKQSELLEAQATSSHFALCLNSLSVFGQLSQTLSQIRQLIPSTLSRLVQTTAAIIRVAFKEDESGDARHLAQFIQLILTQLKSSYEVHCLLDKELAQLKNVDAFDNGSRNSNNGIDFHSLSVSSNYWEIAQEAVQKIVSEYVKEVDASVDGVEKSSNSEKIRFSASACTTSGNFGVKQQPTICPPSPWNITAIFPYLERFCSEREAESGLRQPCSLRRFLHSFVLDVFVDRFRTKLEKLAENALQGRDACYNMFGICEEIGKLIVTMETFTDRLSSLWLLVIQDFLKIASSIYEMIIRPSYEKEEKRERRKISAAWAVDEDISRLLKSLPNWCLAVSNDEKPSSTTPTAILTVIESESEIRQRNERESELLIGNLGTAKQLVKEELITDMELIHSLACMHESLKWFCQNFRTLISSMSDSALKIMRTCKIQYQTHTEPAEHREESIYDAVEGRLVELDTIADTCLLIIHLELRVHCFFYLLPLARVVSFGRDMMQFHQLLNGYLPVQKMKYLFDGLGHLSASIFIHSSQHIQKLSENGRKRVCRSIFAVQQRLSQLTGRRESDLDRARSFYELLSHDPDELLALIIEQGASYSHLEYTYLLSLAIRSHPSLSAQPGALEQRISQLKTILSQLKKQ